MKEKENFSGQDNNITGKKSGRESSEKEHKIEKKYLHKLEDANIDLDYSNLLISAMGHWLSISAFSMLEDLFEDGIIGPGKISDDIGDALDLMFKEARASEKKPLPELKPFNQKQIFSLVEDMKKNGCRFFENLIFSVFEEPVELTIREVVKRLSSGESTKNLDIVTQDGHGHSVFNVEDLESINKYGLPKTEKEFLEDEVLNKLKAEDIIIEPEDEKPHPFYGEISMGQYLDCGGVLLLKRPQGKVEEIKTRDQLWEIEPSLMEKNRHDFLGVPGYNNLSSKILDKGWAFINTLLILNIVILLLIIAYLIYLTLRIGTLSNKKETKKTTDSGSNNNLLAILEEIREGSLKVLRKADTFSAITEDFEKRISNCIERIGLSRSDVFSSETKSNDVSLALLSKHGDGVVISFSKNNFTVKTIGKGQFPGKLTKKEEEAIDSALN